ncbi:hypothetical protein ACFT9M_00750 [Micromonospora purpureochromogenes]
MSREESSHYRRLLTLCRPPLGRDVGDVRRAFGDARDVTLRAGGAQ